MNLQKREKVRFTYTLQSQLFLQKMSCMYQTRLFLSLSILTCSVVLHPSAQHVRRAAKTEGGITLEGAIFFFHSLGNLSSAFHQVTYFFDELIHYSLLPCFHIRKKNPVYMFTRADFTCERQQMNVNYYRSHKPLCDYR